MNSALRVLIVAAEHDASTLLESLRAAPIWAREFVPARIVMRAELFSLPTTESFDLVLCEGDCPDPEMERVLLCLRELYPALPCVVLSACPAQESIGQALRLGAIDVIARDQMWRLEPVLEREARNAHEQRASQALKTERERERHQLQETSARLQAVAQAFHSLYFRVDAEGIILDYGAGRESDLYVVPEAFVGRKMQDVLPPPVDEQFQNAFDGLKNNGAPVSMTYALPLNGRNRSFEARLVPDGDQPGVTTIVARDVTPFIEANREREQMVAIIEASPDFVSTADAQGRLLYINRAGREMLGFGADEDISPLTVKDIDTPDALQKVEAQAFPEALETGVWSGESTLKKRDGGRLPVSKVIVAHRESNGDVAFFSAVARDISDRKGVEDALRETEAKYRSIFENAVIGMFQTTPEGTYQTANNALARIYGYDSAQELMKAVTRIDAQLYVEPGRRETFMALMRESGSVARFESQVRCRDGSIIWISESARELRDAEGKLLGYEGTTLEVTARKEAEAALRQSETRLRDIVEHSSNLFYSHTPDHVLTYVSPQVRNFLECEPQDALLLWTEFLSDNPINQEAMRHTQRAIDSGQAQPVYEMELQGRKGRRVWVEVNEAPVVREGKTVAIVGALVDITKRKSIENELKYQAFHDSLTGLPNRALFMDRLEHALSRSRRDSGNLGVLFLDLDRFKVVNDSLGHEVGDQLLRAVAERLTRCLRPGDTAARLGGDEFTVLVENVNDVSDATLVAERIAQELQAPLKLEGHEVFVTTSVGIALSHAKREGAGGLLDTPDDLLRHADMAMYRAKSNGRSGYEVFDPDMNALAMERLNLETDLWQAIGRNELRAFYMPKVRLEDGALVAYEALMRWQHPTRGLLEPPEFLRLAEETGIIAAIDDWMLEQACRHGARLLQDGQELLKICVNISARRLRQPDLISTVERVLSKTGLKPSALVIEIREDIAMERIETTLDALRRLKTLGVLIALDDFGTGGSSLSQLRHLPLDYLKIDHTFIASLNSVDETGSNQEAAIVRAIISMTHSLNLKVVAEGIETLAQAELLKALGCDFAQGFYFGKPAAAQ